MKLLLDENLPKRLKIDFPKHEVYTVFEMGWTGIRNGQLLQLMLQYNFDALLTFDKNIEHQQNFQKYSLTVFVLSAFNNTYTLLAPLTANINKLLEENTLTRGIVVIRSI